MQFPVRMGVIGAGAWGPNIIRNFSSNPRSTVVTIADRDSERLQVISARYPSLRATHQEDEVLADPGIDAVVICTPTSTHYALSRKALEARKHVFVEKPMATSVEECAELNRLAHDAGVLLFVGHVFVYNAGIQAVKRYLEQEALGRIYYIHVARTNLGPVRSDVSVLWDLVPHDLAILQYWLGELPSEVSAVGGRFLDKRDDIVFATYRFPGGILAHVHASWLNPRKVRQIVIVGEHKMLVWDDMDLNNPICIYDKTVTFTADSHPGPVIDTFFGFRASIHEGDTVMPRVLLHEPLQAECNAFLDALRSPETCISNGVHGQAVVSALVATDRSIQEQGRQVPVP